MSSYPSIVYIFPQIVHSLVRRMGSLLTLFKLMNLLIWSKEERFPHFSYPPSMWLMIFLLDCWMSGIFHLELWVLYCLLKNQNCFLSKSTSVFFFCTVLKVMFILWYIILQILAVLIHTCSLCLNQSYFSLTFLVYEYCFDFWELSVVWQLNINSLMLNLHSSKND